VDVCVGARRVCSCAGETETRIESAADNDDDGEWGGFRGEKFKR